MTSATTAHGITLWRLNSTVQFTTRFLTICIALFFLLEISPDEVYYPLNRANALLAAALLKIFGLSPDANGIIIVVDGFRAKVIGECSAVFASVLPVSFMLAFPAGRRKRILGILVGLTTIFLANILRIGLLVSAGARVPHLFDAIHQYGGQTAMMLVIVLICFAWVQWVMNLEGRNQVWFGLLRCVLLSVVGLIGWHLFSEPYTRLQYLTVQRILAGFDVPAGLPSVLRLYPDTFLCFNYVTLTVLLGTFDDMIPFRRWVFNWLKAMALLTIGHFSFRTVQLLYLSSSPGASLFWTTNALLLFNEWLLPFVLFLWCARKRALFRKK